jgi:UDP-glucose:(heptosyl)LPS alpha-1,3-glucosyltransferase
VKIGLIKQAYVSLSGGAERYTTGLADELHRRGHQIHLFAHRWDKEAAAQPFTFHHVPVIGGASFLKQLSFAWVCRMAVEQSGCDLVFSLERTLRQDVVRAGGGCHREWLLQRARHLSPLARLGSRLNPLHRSLLWLERRTFSPQITRHIIANSHRGREEIVRHYVFPAERIDVVHNGVDCERFRPGKRQRMDEEFVLLFVGSGFARKGLEFAVRVLARLPARVQLRVAGKGQPGPYRRLARRLGVESRLVFLGRTPRIEEVYAQGDLLLHPAIYEPFSNACLEAMACGLPVVTSRINGAAEIIAPGRNGPVVEEPDDIDALARAIEPFLDRKQWREASAAARTTAESLPFTLNVEKTLEIIQRLSVR